MDRVLLTPVYVLHTRPFRNTSLLVDFFSQEYGLVSVVARSARGPKSRYQGQLQLFTPMLAAWFGKHELKTLTQLELQGMPHQLHQKALFSAFYINELISRVLQKEDPHPSLFLHYQNALQRLEENKDIETVLRLFEKRLLEALGFGLPLQYEAQTHQLLRDDLHYDFLPAQGFVQNEKGVFSGRVLHAIAAEDFSTAETLLATKRLMRLALIPVLGNKPLHSRELFANSASSL